MTDTTTAPVWLGVFLFRLPNAARRAEAQAWIEAHPVDVGHFKACFPEAESLTVLDAPDAGPGRFPA
ncbi:hypothetical protein CSQ96_22580 [Janthinobacterium sp. BJB412]|nr:hypothetical protein CSQ96_22580 [Janthinobacterium sp. BJB412]